MKKIYDIAVFIFFITTLPAYADYIIYCKDGGERVVKDYQITETDVTYTTKYGTYHLPLDKVDIEKTEYERDMRDHGPRWQEMQRKAEENQRKWEKEAEEAKKKELENPIAQSKPSYSPELAVDPPSKPQLVRPEIPPPLTSDSHGGESMSQLKEKARTAMLAFFNSVDAKGIGIISAYNEGPILILFWDYNSWKKTSSILSLRKVKIDILLNYFSDWNKIMEDDARLIIKNSVSNKVLAEFSKYNYIVDGILVINKR